MSDPKRRGINPSPNGLSTSSLAKQLKKKRKGKSKKAEPSMHNVEKILEKRYVNGRAQLLLKWAGYPIEESTWEPIENLSGDCMRMLADFEAALFAKQCQITRKQGAVPSLLMNTNQSNPIDGEKKKKKKKRQHASTLIDLTIVKEENELKNSRKPKTAQQRKVRKIRELKDPTKPQPEPELYITDLPPHLCKDLSLSSDSSTENDSDSGSSSDSSSFLGSNSDNDISRHSNINPQSNNDSSIFLSNLNLLAKPNLSGDEDSDVEPAPPVPPLETLAPKEAPVQLVAPMPASLTLVPPAPLVPTASPVPPAPLVPSESSVPLAQLEPLVPSALCAPPVAPALYAPHISLASQPPLVPIPPTATQPTTAPPQTSQTVVLDCLSMVTTNYYSQTTVMSLKEHTHKWKLNITDNFNEILPDQSEFINSQLNNPNKSELEVGEFSKVQNLTMNSNSFEKTNYQIDNRHNKSKSSKKSRSNNFDPMMASTSNAAAISGISAVPKDRSRKKSKSNTDFAVGHNQMGSTKPMSPKQNRHASPDQSSSSSSRSSSCSRSSGSSAHTNSNGGAQAQTTANNLLSQIGNWDDALQLPARPLGIERGLALEKILKSFKMRGETYLVVKWKAVTVLDAVSLSGIIELYPHIVIEYFEKLQLRCPDDD